MYRRPGFSRGRRHQGSADVYFLFLLLQLFQQIVQLERKPPVTLAIMGANFLVHFKRYLPDELLDYVGYVVPSIGEGCLQPARIWRNGQWSRLLWSAILHVDAGHLYYNMSSLLWKGVHLELRMGSVAFAGLVGELLLLSHSLIFGLSAVLAGHVPMLRFLYRDHCSVGFSAVLFALKVVLNHDSPGWSQYYGFSLPTKYLCWAELVVIKMLSPQASFFGHLCGILAGSIHVWLLLPFCRRLQRSGVLPALRRSRYYNSSRGTTASHTASTSAASRGGGSHSRPGGSSGGSSSGTAAGVAGRGVSGWHGREPSAAAQPTQPVERRRELESAEGRGMADGSGAGRSEEGQVSPRPESVEEVRQRRLQRFGAADAARAGFAKQ